MLRLWKCEVCGYVHTGDAPPDECPVCGVGADQFSAMDAVAVASADAAVPAEAGAPSGEPRDGPAIVILGAGVAGVTAAEHARRAAPDARITLVGEEAGPSYYRLNLTRYLAGGVEEASLVLAGEDWAAAQRVERVEGEAVAIDRGARAVTLADGRRLPYERLILATGARPFVPPIGGAGRAGVLTLRTLGDARRLRELGRPGARAVCIGGGLLGLETAGALARRGARVTVLEGAPWLLPRQLAEPPARLLARHLEGLGIAVRTAAKVEELTGGARVEGVRLAGGELHPAELVVVAAGVRPEARLARAAGLEVRAGVVVDDRLTSSDPAILAAGDAAEHGGVVYGLWPAAHAQGLVAGTNAAGGHAAFRALAPANRLKVLDVELMSIGAFQATDGAVWEEASADRAVRLVTRDGRLVGANLFGEPELAAVVKEAVESAAPLAARPELLARFPEGFRRGLGTGGAVA